MAHKNNNGKINTLARELIQRMFTNYKKFKTNIRQVFRDIKQQNTARKKPRYLK
jgi:hypothetical protein